MELFVNLSLNIFLPLVVYTYALLFIKELTSTTIMDEPSKVRRISRVYTLHKKVFKRHLILLRNNPDALAYVHTYMFLQLISLKARCKNDTSREVIRAFLSNPGIRNDFSMCDSEFFEAL